MALDLAFLDVGLADSAGCEKHVARELDKAPVCEVPVKVTAMSGATLAEFRCNPTLPTAALKQRVYELSGVPAAEQRLALAVGNATPLRDAQCLADCTILAAEEVVEVLLVRVEAWLALSWSADRTMRLWDLAAGTAVHDFGGYVGNSQPSNVEVDWEQGLALTWGGEKNMRLWDIHSGEVLQVLSGHSGEVLGVQVDRAEGRRRRALSWAADRTLRVWDLRIHMSTELRGHSGGITQLHVGWEHQRALSCGDDGMLYWDLEVGVLLNALRGLTGAQLHSLHPSWKSALVLSADSAAHFWDLCETWKVSLQTWRRRVTSVDMDWSTRRSLSWCKNDDTLWLCDASGSALTEQAADGLFAVQVNWAQSLAVSWSNDGQVVRPLLWHLGEGGAPILEPQGGALGSPCAICGNVDFFEVSWDRRRALTWNEDREDVCLWDLVEGVVLMQLRGHASRIDGTEVDWSSDRLITWSGHDTSLRLWDLGCGTLAREITRDPYGSFGVKVDWARNCVLTWTAEGWGNCEFTLELWDLHTGSAVQVLGGHADVVRGAAVAPPRQHRYGCAAAQHAWAGPASRGPLSGMLRHAGPTAPAGVADEALLASFMAGELDSLISEYRERLRSMPRGPPRGCGRTRASGQAIPYVAAYVPMEAAAGRSRLLMLGDANTMGAPHTNAAPVAYALASMNAAVLVENDGWGGLFAMMLAEPHLFNANTGGKLPLPAPSEYRCEFACILIGSMEAMAISGKDTVVEAMCVSEDTPVRLPIHWKETCRPTMERFEVGLRSVVKGLRAAEPAPLRIAITTPPPLGEDLSESPPSDKLVRNPPARVVRQLATIVRRVAAAEDCDVLPLCECCAHRLRQLEAGGRRPLPWAPREFWKRMIHSRALAEEPGEFRPWEDLLPGEFGGALCHDTVKLNESGAAVYAALVQTWLDFQQVFNAVEEPRTR